MGDATSCLLSSHLFFKTRSVCVRRQQVGPPRVALDVGRDRAARAAAADHGAVVVGVVGDAEPLAHLVARVHDEYPEDELASHAEDEVELRLDEEHCESVVMLARYVDELTDDSDQVEDEEERKGLLVAYEPHTRVDVREREARADERHAHVGLAEAAAQVCLPAAHLDAIATTADWFTKWRCTVVGVAHSNMGRSVRVRWCWIASIT